MDERPEFKTNEKFAIDRRSLLKGSTGSMAAMAAFNAFGMDAFGQEDDPALTGLKFFTKQQAAVIEALADQFWPLTDASLSGSDAGVLYYIDGALAGAYEEYQMVYRTGLMWLNDVSEEEFGADFPLLSFDDQTILITTIFEENDEDTESAQIGAEDTHLESGTPVAVEEPISEFSQPRVAGLEAPSISSLQEFMDLVLKHTMEGLFSDPIYGGNRDFAGWRAVGYPGAHYVYSEEEQQSFEPLDKPFQSIADL